LFSVARKDPEKALPPDFVIVVDDAAGEAAVLGGDAGRDRRRLLDGVLDEEVERRPADVVLDARAVQPS